MNALDTWQFFAVSLNAFSPVVLLLLLVVVVVVVVVVVLVFVVAIVIFSSFFLSKGLVFELLIFSFFFISRFFFDSRFLHFLYPISFHCLSCSLSPPSYPPSLPSFPVLGRRVVFQSLTLLFHVLPFSAPGSTLWLFTSTSSFSARCSTLWFFSSASSLSLPGVPLSHSSLLLFSFSARCSTLILFSLLLILFLCPVFHSLTLLFCSLHFLFPHFLAPGLHISRSIQRSLVADQSSQ